MCVCVCRRCAAARRRACPRSRRRARRTWRACACACRRRTTPAWSDASARTTRWRSVHVHSILNIQPYHILASEHLLMIILSKKSSKVDLWVRRPTLAKEAGINARQKKRNQCSFCSLGTRYTRTENTKSDMMQIKCLLLF